jgi:hypothetical protein
MRLVLNPCFRMVQGDIPILYSSLRARQRASSKAVFPDPTGLSISPGSCLVAKQYTSHSAVLDPLPMTSYTSKIPEGITHPPIPIVKALSVQSRPE